MSFACELKKIELERITQEIPSVVVYALSLQYCKTVLHIYIVLHDILRNVFILCPFSFLICSIGIDLEAVDDTTVLGELIA